ncbi:hypothetical protein [Bacillus altitudinis]|uniref:hypothetical protein n=1 Tax=Bacillus altitudinis TaxID=293387 RepID=UPI0023579549|nr:hypothetical protein [Bacillus altitudinis]
MLVGDGGEELKGFCEDLSMAVGDCLMGKGGMGDDDGMRVGMRGFWGRKFMNDECKGGEYILVLGRGFGEGDASWWEWEYTLNLE